MAFFDEGQVLLVVLLAKGDACRNFLKRSVMSSLNQSPSSIGMTLSSSGRKVGSRHLAAGNPQRFALVGQDQAGLSSE